MRFFTRSASLDGFAQLVSELGLDPLALVREIGLPPACLNEPDLKISSGKLFALFELAAERSGASDLGLRLAAARDFATLGAVGLVMREQPTVRKAMQALASHVWAHSEGLSLQIEEADGIAILAPLIMQESSGPANQATELTVARIVRLMRRFLGASWVPEMVMFRHARPDGVASHTRLFGRLPLFGQERSAVVALSTDLDCAIPGADPNVASQLVRYLEFVAGSRDASHAERVREVINVLLPRGQCRIDVVARHFGVDRRTVHRNLGREGTSFTSLLEQERRDLAQAYLADCNRSLTEIAEMLGFSCLSAFSRWKRKALQSISQKAPPSVQASPGQRAET